MPFENASTIPELNPLFPLGSDPVAEGDNHIRSLKVALQTFYNVNYQQLIETVYQAGGYPLVSGSFEKGGTITTAKQSLLFEVEGIAYSWGGALPKVVPVGSTPSSTGGIGPTAWVSRENESFAAALAGNDGANLIGGMTYTTLRSYTGGATTVYVVGRSSVFDGGFGYFDLDVTDTVSADNGGTIIVDANGGRWKRRFTGSTRLEWFADNTASVSAVAGLQAAHDSLPSWGGVIEATGFYIIDSPMTFTKRLVIKGGSSAELNTNSATVFVKAATCLGDMFSFSGGSSGLQDCVLKGVAGNTGDGLVVLGGRSVNKNVSIYAMGRDGMRIGSDAGVNANCWYAENIRSKYNGRYGLHISDKLNTNPTLPDCNGGVLLGADLQNNANTGLYLGAAQINTFINVVSQTNGGRGIDFTEYARSNTMIGGDSESNNGDELYLAAGSTGNKVIGTSVYGSMSDLGSGNVILGTAGSGFTGLSIGNVASSLPTVLDWYEEVDISAGVTVSFVTPGDLAVNYVTKKVQAQRVGNRVTVSFFIECSVTYTTASGALKLTGLPWASSSSGGNVATGSLNARGITTASNPVVCPTVLAGYSEITFRASGPGVAFVVPSTAHVASGSTLHLAGTVTYIV